MLEFEMEVAPRERLVIDENTVATLTIEDSRTVDEQMLADGHQNDAIDKFCGRLSDGLTNCPGCLSASISVLSEEALVIYRVLERLGPDGVSKPMLQVSYQTNDMSLF